MKLFSSAPAQPLPKAIKAAGLALLLFLCVFIPFRSPLSDLAGAWVKAIPDVLILALAVWYAVVIRFRFRFLPQDLLFLLLEALALVSTVFINGNSIGLWIYQTRAVGIYYILYFVVRNFGFGKDELTAFTRTLQLTSLPLFALGLVEKLFSKTVLFNTALAATLDKINFSRVYSTFQNPNTYGMFLVFVVALSLYIWYAQGKKTPVWLYCTLAISLYMTMSRSSLLILAAALVIFVPMALVGRKRDIRWKKFVLSLICIAAAAMIVPKAVNFAAQKYFEAVGQYKLTLAMSEKQIEVMNPVTYLNSKGEKCTGYAFYGITYVDKECTKPLEDYGAIVFVNNEQYILTIDGGMILEEFQALPEDQQAALLDDSNGVRRDARENSYITAARDSLEVDTGTRFGDFKDEKLYSANTNGRLYSLATAFTIAKDYPIWGVGYGSYGSSASLTREEIPLYEKYDIRVKFYADNQYAAMLAETGFVGFAVFMIFLLATLWHYRKNLLKVAVCVIIAWFGLFYNVLEIQMGSMLLWTILAMDLGDLTPQMLLGKEPGKIA